MKKSIFLSLKILICSCFSCSNKEPFKSPYENIGGYVIGSETCNTDTTQDYWLLDFTVYPNSPHIGDTLTLNGTSYTNLLKVKGLHERLRQLGMRVAIDYNVVTPDTVTTVGCTVSSPVTYNLKEITIINQGEIR